jgi:phosphatidylethanolamine-binding protein (PEBP) family uncharacterized protein
MDIFRYCQTGRISGSFQCIFNNGKKESESAVNRYFFKLYALDTALSLASGATKAQVEKAVQGHILAEAQLMGKYKR